ncbi:hypothetical protein A2344_00150 [Candidatus Peregrinibacteria bacterium RIFOXYB12_FULL_41_12]|nr:MAG: hypothetical protein A2244_02845 [Candidatus Peregrinibacteria bacterium RIFOXYA2_FULL_41_18]OGJ48955.1 MAG: hypothetical protein A2344_00150 [Candidatus Peregrinibacteria bacterium RIFOXYB12_FULL_41_12]OGJ52627.1 MAG: hypothetical protein A2448_02610 [Candidatus Peregrinibacteria bacterium RIFOXYC2_FULL_41_22]OGJ53618.1 MAG: hypothetical protein A2336_00925 [Candidatus Peregrinibacteria bacterium RIFOXYB2_FULL_41_88]
MDAKSKIRIHVIGLLTKQFVNDNLSNSGKSYRSKCDDNPEPSFTLCDEGVETRWQGPVALKERNIIKFVFAQAKTHLAGQGIVQITNLKRVVKTIVISITDWSLVRSQPGPPVRRPSQREGRSTFIMSCFAQAKLLPILPAEKKQLAVT